MKTGTTKMAAVKDNEINDMLNENMDVEFERMLNDFISSELSDVEELQQAVEEAEENLPAPPIMQTQTAPVPSPAAKEIPETTFKASDIILLNEHENALFRAYSNYMYAIDTLAEEHKKKTLPKNVRETDLAPHFKKKAGKKVSNDILSGWDILIALFPDLMHKVRPDSTDDELLDFAESLTDENLQLAIISYVETLIELEGCEIDYEARRLKHERRKLEKEIYEEHQARLNRIKKYTQAIQDKKFPVDAEKLVNNYFRLSNKDPEGSFKALVNNPATFAPIDFSKIKARFFGLLKVTPQDGIRINQKLGAFLRKLKA